MVVLYQSDNIKLELFGQFTGMLFLAQETESRLAHVQSFGEREVEG